MDGFMGMSSRFVLMRIAQVEDHGGQQHLLLHFRSDASRILRSG